MRKQDRIKELFNEYTEKHNFSGAGLVRIGEEILFKEGRGYAHKAWKVPNTPTTKFDTASITKLFTAAASFQLVDKGLLKLEDRILDIIDIGETKIPKEVTVYHLLNHISGIADDADEEAGEEYEAIWREKPSYMARELADFLPNFIHKEPNFKPGEQHRYNNVGFILVGLAIEKVTGMSYRDYVKNHVFEAAGMKDSEFCSFDGVFENMAEGYASIENEAGEITGYRKNIFCYPPIGSPDSGAFTTVVDLDIFLRALWNGQLLSKKLTEEIFRDQKLAVDNENVRYMQSYALDSMYRKKYNTHSYGKDGINPGVANICAYYPEQDLTIAIMANQDCNVWQMHRDMLDILFGNQEA